MKVGFIGLGKLGAPMARHIIEAGHCVRGFDVDRARLADVPGAAAAETVAALGPWADVVVSSLPADQALLAVAGELVPALATEAIWVETSTVAPSTCEAVRAMGHRGYLASPVSGSTATAAAASLTLFCSGPPEALDRVRPVLSCFAKDIAYVGQGAEARFLKLAINHFVGTTAQIAAEALTLARRGGVEWNVVLDVLAKSVAASPLLAYKMPLLRARDFAPAFTTAQMAKDMSLTVAAGAGVGMDMPLASLVRDAFRRQAATGLEHQDFFAAVLEAEAAAGLGKPA